MILDPVFVDDAHNTMGWKGLLLEAFGLWYDPVRALIEATSMHRHCTNLVFELGE
jgi:hypothetical protein